MRGINSKGFLFTVMVVFMVFALLALNETINGISGDFSVKPANIGLGRVSTAYRNAGSLVLDFDDEGYALEAAQRVLPFDYNLSGDLNSLLVSYSFPFSQGRLDDAFNYFGLTGVILGDKNYSNAFGGVVIDANLPKNQAWNGGDSLGFVVQNECYSFVIQNAQQAALSPSASSKCTRAFSQDMLKRIDINVEVLSSTSDFNSFLCNGATCPQSAFNPADPRPYYTVRIIDSNCSSCALAQKIASSHFSSGDDLNIVLKCNGGSCVSTPLVIMLQPNFFFGADYSSDKKLQITEQITFSDPPGGFISLNSSLNATYPDASQGN